MSIQFQSISIPDCLEAQFGVQQDQRGSFIKTVHAATFCQRGLPWEFAETFYTISGKNVLRGMHLQLPPADQWKLAYCMSGAVMDVLLDLRRGSPAFGQFTVIELSAECRNGVYIPPGVAHGFLVREAPAVMVYHVTKQHCAAADAGVRWDSFQAPWPVDSPVLSARDAALPALRDFQTPFEFAGLRGGAAA